MLEQFLVTELFAFLIVFCRMGSAIMLLPGVGEAFVSPRTRLLFALAVSLVITPVTQVYMPPVPGSILGLTVLIVMEVLVGVFIGLLARMLLAAMHTAGMIIAFQSGLAAAMMFDPTAGTQGSPFGNLLSMTAIMLLFALDMHHVILIGVADSYSLFAPGMFPPVGDFAQTAAYITSSILMVAVAFTAPHMVMGLLVYLGSGILSRLMPAMHVFFVIIPLQILVSVMLLMVTITTGMLMYMSFFEDTMLGILNP